jgi:uncharacterized beta-barrel protein YwiB (DUF1934 family)
MEENYLISIVGKQYVDGETGEIQLTTRGSYVSKGSNRYISYDEYDQDTPGLRIRSVLKVEGGQRVTLIRSGGQNSRLVLEKGQRHLCHYDTGFGSMMVGVFADKIHTSLGDSGGNLEISYSLDINAGLTSMNEIFINVKEAENNDVNFSKPGDQ